MANFDGPQIKSKTIKADSPQVAVADTSGYQAMADGFASMGSNVAGALGSINKNGNGKKGSRLDRRIEKAKEKGNQSKVTRLEGRKERRTQRDKEREKREAQRNKERMVETKRRSESKTEKFLERRVGDDGKLGTEDDKRPFDIAQPLTRKTPFPMKTFDKFSKIAKKL